MIELMIIFILFVLGLILGSFVNALVWRVHEQSKSKKKTKDLSIVRGRSMCSSCKHELAGKDLIPVLSWVMLRGKCRYCHKPIKDSPIVELSLPIVFVISYIWWPFNWGGAGTFNFVVWLVALVGLTALFVYDMKWQLLPNRIIYPMLFGAVAATLVQAALFDNGLVLLRDAALAGTVGGGLFYVLFMVSAGKWIGGGDVKLGALLGILLINPVYSLLMLFVASVLGTAFILPGLVTKKITPKSRIPFGPFLIIAAIIVKLFAASFVSWYDRVFLTI